MILALDLGTTRVKGGLFNPRGECLATSSVDLPHRDEPDPLASTVDALDWIAAVRTIDDILLAGRIRPDCVVFSGNGPTLVPVDASDRPLFPALTWMDRRMVAEADLASEAAGTRIDPSFYLPKALWFARHHPGLYERTSAFYACPEYLIRLVSGVSVTVFPAQGYEALYWREDWLRALGLEAGKFPPFVAPGAIVGTTAGKGAAELSLPTGIPVVAGGPDFLAALAGTATTKPGRACDRAGTSEGINLCSATAVKDSRLLCMPHIIRPWTNVSGSVSTSGKALEWFRCAAYQGEVGYEELFREAARVEAGAKGLLFLPYLAGERAPLWDASARGAFVGLTLAHGRAEMLRAVIEATALAVRDVLEVMEEAGAPVEELRVTGKPGSSEVWNRIKADITGLPLRVPRFGESELLGGACMGFAALGHYASLAEAAEDLVALGPPIEPNPANKARYDELFGIYRESYRALKPLFPRLAKLP